MTKTFSPLGILISLALITSCSDGGEAVTPPDADAALPADIFVDLAPDARPPDAALPDAPVADMAWPKSCSPSFKGLKGQALKKVVHVLINGHKSLGYSKAREAIFLAKGGGIDLSGGEVTCVYTGRKAKITGDKIPDDMNVEHSWPQSKGASKEPAKSDLHHLFPSDAMANNKRGNYPFGEPDCAGCGCSWSVGGSTLGYAAGCSERVFKVAPGRSGDIARAQFYFALRYLYDSDAIPAQVEKVLRAWHAKDPVDSQELARNGAIEALQQNRNPIVDCPLLLDLILDF